MGLRFRGHFIETHTNAHSKNMSQDVFMALLLCTMTGNKKNVCGKAAGFFFSSTEFNINFR